MTNLLLDEADERVAELTDTMISQARLDFAARAPVRADGPLDGIAVGLEKLGQELQAVVGRVQGVR